jgi:hypothetical protein
MGKSNPDAFGREEALGGSGVSSLTPQALDNP